MKGTQQKKSGINTRVRKKNEKETNQEYDILTLMKRLKIYLKIMGRI